MVSRFEHRRGSGLFAGEKTVTKLVAFTVDGDERIVAESEELEGSVTEDTDGSIYGAPHRRGLIAHLGLDGWEPVLLAHGEYGSIRWYFKRQLPDA